MEIYRYMSVRISLISLGSFEVVSRRQRRCHCVFDPLGQVRLSIPPPPPRNHPPPHFSNMYRGIILFVHYKLINFAITYDFYYISRSFTLAVQQYFWGFLRRFIFAVESMICLYFLFIIIFWWIDFVAKSSCLNDIKYSRSHRKKCQLISKNWYICKFILQGKACQKTLTWE